MSARQLPDAPEAASPPRFRLTLLGGASLRGANGVELLGPGVPLAVLAYLHVATGRSASREHLADTFWPNSDQTHARQALRQNLSRLRNLLGPDAFEDHGSEVRLTAAVGSDRDDFLAAIARHDFEAAFARYSGQFFTAQGSPGTADFEHWVDGERERLRNLFLRAGEGLVRLGLDHARPREVLPLSVRLRQEAPESETMRRLQLEVLLATRDEQGARSAADSLVKWLKEEARPPEPATTRLVRLAREGESRGRDPDEAQALHPELVGREKEFLSIVKEWHEAGRRAGRHLHIEGQAGLGKTRLLVEAGSRISALGGKVIYVRAQSGERQLGCVLAADLAGELCTLPGAKAVPSRTAAVLLGLNPALGSLFASVPPETGGSNQLQQRTLALGDLIASVAEESPLALLIDDVHWMDEESRIVVGGAVARLGKPGVLTLSAGRPGGSGSFAGGEIRRLLLAPLNLGDTEALLRSLGSLQSEGVGRRLGAAFFNSSRGSPLLLLETLQLAVDGGRLERQAGAWNIPDLDSLIDWLGQRNALEARLASLSPPARKFLLTLAATGAPLARTDVERAVDSGAVSPDTLTELERRGYISPRGKRWDLAHDEIGETVVRLAGEAERRAVHASLGRALLARGIENRGAAQRAARHLLEGGADNELDAVFRNWVVAARRRGDRTAPAGLVRDLLGELATPARVERLVGALPATERWPMLRWFT